MIKKLFFDVTIAVRSPYVFSGLKVAGFGFDTSAIRDENTGPDEKASLTRALIPGDHLRGHLRHSLETLEQNTSVIKDDIIDKLFGGESDEGSNDQPNRGAIQISDLIETGVPQSQGFSRIAINDETGVVEEGALQVIELAAKLNETTTFSGSIMVFWDEDKASDLEALLDKALKIIPAMGAIKSSGFGELVQEECSIKFKKALPCYSTARAGAYGQRVAFDVTFDRPILVDAHRVSDNVFAGRETIPGGAIKGTLARAFQKGGMPAGMNDDLAKVVFSHSFLVDGKNNEVFNRPLPLSMVSDIEGKEIRDILKEYDNQGRLLSNKAVVYQGDWKSDKVARTQAKRPGLIPHEIARTKTAIDHVSNTADDQNLYVTVARATKGLTWRFVLDQNGAEDDNFTTIVQTLKDGLHGVGRTEAVASFKIVDDTAPCPTPLTIKGKQYWPIMLETDAVLSDPNVLDDIGEQYKAYFKTLGAELHAFFATQRPAGGYVAVRFTAFGENEHQPFEITEAGSVFLLSGVDEKTVTNWCKTGLPPAKNKGETLTWENCPFVAENGYGAVSVDGELHERLKLEMSR